MAAERTGGTLYGAMLRGLVLPLGDRVYGQRMTSRLKFLEKAQWWSPERIAAERRRLLGDLMEVAYREVPFYRRLRETTRLAPDARSRVPGLEGLPVVTKAMLRAAYPDGTCRPTGQRTYEACTSGSTGSNFCVREDMETAGWYRASSMLALEWSGWRIGDPHLQTGITPHRNREKYWKDRLLRCHYVSAYVLDDAALDRALEAMERQRIEYLFGYPASLYYLARRAAAVGWNRKLRSAVTWGDMLYPHYRREIESVFGVRMFDTYGCCEGMQISAQCGADAGYHVHALDVIVEFVDDEGRPVPPGTVGNIVVTRLHPGPMPLIRYSIGDLGTAPATDRPCACGRGFERMEGLQGRKPDVIVTPTGNRLIVHFFTGVLEHFSEIENYQVIQEERDRLRVVVVPGRGYDATTEGRIRSRLREYGLTDMAVDVETTPEIPLPKTTKHRFVLSRVAPTELKVDAAAPGEKAS